MDMVSSEITVTATEFKAKCLDILKRLGERRLKQVTITRRGKPVGVLIPPKLSREDVAASFGAMAGTVHIPEGFDLTAPAFEGKIDAEEGILYNE